MGNIEREFKTGITREKYYELINELDLKDKSYLQTNYYFDTDDLELKKKEKTLRIRIKEISIHLTLKEHVKDYTKETTINLTKEEASNYIKNGIDGNQYGIDKLLVNVSKLSTKRTKLKTKYGMLFFDMNNYNNITDYEIEYEVDDKISTLDGLFEFNHFLKENGIPFVKLKSKSKRAIETRK